MNEFVLLDAAKMSLEIFTARQLNKNSRSIYRGDGENHLTDVSPYLFSLQNELDFYRWYFEKGWGDSWGTVVFSNVSFDEIYKHFRKFLLVKTEDGQELYFRFYDPRVLKIFLPTCDANQIKEFFGPVESFIVEGDTKEEAIRFWQHNGELKQEILPVEDVFGKVIQNNEV